MTATPVAHDCCADKGEAASSFGPFAPVESFLVAKPGTVSMGSSGIAGHRRSNARASQLGPAWLWLAGPFEKKGVEHIPPTKF